MAIFEWNDDLSIEPTVDGDHQQFISVLNDVYDAMSIEDQSIVKPTLKKLAQYTEDHFSREEAFMTLIGYLGFEQHKKEHDRIREIVNDMQVNHVVSEELLRFLFRWLLTHIMKEDKKIRP